MQHFFELSNENSLNNLSVNNTDLQKLVDYVVENFISENLHSFTYKNLASNIQLSTYFQNVNKLIITQLIDNKLIIFSTGILLINPDLKKIAKENAHKKENFFLFCQNASINISWSYIYHKMLLNDLRLIMESSAANAQNKSATPSNKPLINNYQTVGSALKQVQNRPTKPLEYETYKKAIATFLYSIMETSKKTDTSLYLNDLYEASELKILTQKYKTQLQDTLISHGVLTKITNYEARYQAGSNAIEILQNLTHQTWAIAYSYQRQEFHVLFTQEDINALASFLKLTLDSKKRKPEQVEFNSDEQASKAICTTPEQIFNFDTDSEGELSIDQQNNGAPVSTLSSPDETLDCLDEESFHSSMQANI